MEKVEKSQSAVFFQCFEAPEGRKVGSLKPKAGVEPFSFMKDQKLHATVPRSAFPSQIANAPQRRNIFANYAN